jgi:hypothetical protein
MARAPRIVAELGRPETPEETADRKAEASRVYRSSQTTRNLIAALLVTLGVVVVIILAVPRGTAPEREPIDVAASAQGVAASEGRTVITPDAPADWAVNGAAIENDGTVRAWTVVYVPERGFLRIAQGFDADESWPARVLGGSAPTDSVTLDGIEWQRYDIGDPSRAGNVSVALATEAGRDTVIIYGDVDDATLEQAAAAVSDQIVDLRQEAE